MSDVAKNEPMLAIVGPTGSGKSALALAVAERLGGEIISCDSIQIYRGFNVGSAKPSADEQQRVPHHLIDVADWDEPYDAQMYQESAEAARADILARSVTPVMCGGTGLYLRLWRWGSIDVPASDPELRATIEQAEAECPGETLRRLHKLDPESASTLDSNNLRHLVRALEICIQAGRAASVIRKEHGFRSELVPMRVIWMQREAEALRARIRDRIERMMEQDLLGEVEGLLAQGVSETCSSMTSVGYREACDVVRSRASRVGLEDRIFKSTWAYARRQRTWLRKERQVEALPFKDLDTALEQVLSHLE